MESNIEKRLSCWETNFDKRSKREKNNIAMAILKRWAIDSGPKVILYRHWKEYFIKLFGQNVYYYKCLFFWKYNNAKIKQTYYYLISKAL